MCWKISSINSPAVCLLVSHDRYFMDHLVNQLLRLRGRWNTFGCSMETIPTIATGWKNRRQHRFRKQRQHHRPKRKSLLKRRRQVLKRNRNTRSLSRRLNALGEEKAEITDRLNQGSANHQELQQWSAEIQLLTDQIDQKTSRWVELSEIVE